MNSATPAATASSVDQQAALAGVRILDLTRLLPGNFATLLLAGLGADVVKIEQVEGGDGIRHLLGSGHGGEAAAHMVLNRGKRSLTVDLKAAQGRDLLLELVAEAQVLIDSFRPGVLDRLGLSAEALLAANPTLVHVSINAFGSTGPYKTRPAHDLNSSGYAGALGLVVDSDGAPTLPGLQSADLAAGLHAALAVLSGLRVAEGQGRDFRADVAMTDSVASMLPLAVATLAGTGQPPAVPDLLTGSLACYGVYECADRKWLTVGGLEAKFFARMVELMGRPELADQQYDIAKQEQLRQELSAAFKTRSRAEWIDALAGEDTCVGPVLTVEEALAEPHFLDRGTVTNAAFRDGTQVPVIRSVPWAAEGDEGLAAPKLGEHNEQVLAEAGLDPQRIAYLIGNGIVGGPS
ncbi:MAG: CaiB/BaiF CoA transferase family protein [Candidatus Nanopelagicales bacterium]